MANHPDFVAVILAAGQGTRMKSTKPKVLHEAGGAPLCVWPMHAAQKAGARHLVMVLGYGRELVEAALHARFPGGFTSALQPEQRGTGDAVRCGMETLSEYAGTIVVLYGDCPLVPAEAITSLITERQAKKAPLALLTSQMEDPTGYGRILRGPDGAVREIREHRDCSPAELQIHEVNPGIYAIDADFLREALGTLSTKNTAGELYLTDVVARAAERGGAVSVPWDIHDLRGVNDRFELALADKALRLRIAKRHAQGGATIRDPESVWIDPEVEIAPDAVIEPRVTLRGRTRIAEGAHIDVGAVLDHVTVHKGARVKAYTVATDSILGEGAEAGPFSHLRPGSDLGPEAKIGNFVEVKKTKLGRGSKANHLAYLGDGIIGDHVNVGAGTIFCNYDGFQKHTTVLEDDVFIGSDSQLVAPVKIGKGAYVATGTTVTRDVPADALAIARTRQENKEGYAARLKAKLKGDKK
jgi:bifunctional UDP-N-acetylglucosamine pyrophosphorylase/glucosamine-1-phosphate N-acetyltransferase